MGWNLSLEDLNVAPNKLEDLTNCSYSKFIKLEYDPMKEQLNVSNHGISLGKFVKLDWASASILPDDRRSYGEARYIAVAELQNILHVTFFTLRGGVFRVISLRRANKRETRRYHDSKE